MILAISFMVTLAIFVGVAALVQPIFDKKHKKDALKLQLSNVETAIQDIESLQPFRWVELIDIHKMLQPAGILPDNCNIDPYGMYRADAICNLSIYNIYLGNIYGLWTFPISYWLEQTDEQAKTIVWNQYKNQLLSNLKALQNKLNSEYYDM